MDLAIHYASEETRAAYSKAEPVLRVLVNNPAILELKEIGGWNPKTNTLTLYMVSGKDIDPSGKYKKMKWETQISCAMPETKEAIDVSSYLTQQGRALYKIISDGANQSNFMPKQDFQSLVLKSPDKVFYAISGIASSSLQQRYSATNFSQSLNDNRYNIVLVSVPDIPSIDYKDTVKGLSGIEIKKYTLKGSELAHYLASLAHELAHGIMGASEHEFGAGQYDCVALNFRTADFRAWHEGVADVFSAIALDEAVKLGLITAQDRDATLREIEALRAIGNFNLSQNSLQTTNNTGIHIHLTTILFDSTKRGMTDDFMRVRNAHGFTAIPTIVNSLAQTISGFVYAHYLQEDIRKNPKKYSKEIRETYTGLIKTPVGAVIPFVDLGVRVHFGSEKEETIPAIESQPAYYYQAMKYLKDSGGFEFLQKTLNPSFRPVFDDLIDDYFKAVHFFGEDNFYNLKVQQEFNKYMPKNLDYRALLIEIIKESNNPGRVGGKFEGGKPLEESLFSRSVR